MNDLAQYRKQTEHTIVEKVLEALEKNKLSQTQLPSIGEFVLSGVRIAKNKDDLDVILADLYQKWPAIKDPNNSPTLNTNPDQKKTKDEEFKNFLKDFKQQQEAQ